MRNQQRTVRKQPRNRYQRQRRRSDEFSQRARVVVYVRQLAQQLAAADGLDVDAVLAEAERIAAGLQRGR